MIQCSCSTRALELFVREFAGISLRPSQQIRPRNFSLRQHGLSVERRFGTRHSLQEQINGFSTQATVDDGSSNGEVGAIKNATNGTIDAVRLHGLDMHVLSNKAHVPMLQTPQDLNAVASTSEDKPLEESGSSRAVSRMKRKLRRMQAGTWQPSAKAQQSETEVPVENLQTVLDKIEGMDGPSIHQHIRNITGSETKSKSTVERKDKTKLATEKKGKDFKKREKATDTKTAKAAVVFKREPWQEQKKALSHKFGEEGWQPRKRLSPDTLEGIRTLHASDPTSYTTQVLSEHFKISPEAIRRVLKSKWKPNDRELDDRKARWERRGVKKWQDMADKGMRPPAKWRALGVGSEEGPKEDRIPKRKKKDEDGLAWDDVVKDIHVDGFSERIL